MSKKVTIIGLIMSFLMFAAVVGTDISNAEEDMDYIKGRPLTEEEIQKQKDLEPELKNNVVFKDKQIRLKDDDTQTKMRRLFGVPIAKYDMREETWANGIQVKSQKQTGLCWAFASTTTAEASYLHSQYEAGVSSYSPVTLSAIHLGYFFYNRVNDPLGSTTLDKNVLNPDDSYGDVGGNNIMTFQALANWTGFAADSKVPFPGYQPPTSLMSDLAYDNDVILENAEFLDSTSEVKQSIVDNGAIAAGMYYEDDYINYNTAAYYFNGFSGNGNHAITVVGWDDNYAKENFNIENQPENNGAWIIQNSYGAAWGEGGYFYISYEDTALQCFMSLDVQDADTYDYNYQYDGNAYPGEITLYAGEQMANVYNVPDKGKIQMLEAVGFTQWNETPTDYTVEIYSDVEGTLNPVSGIKECSFDVSTNNAGFRTFELSDYQQENIYLESGSKYSIIVTPKSTTSMGVESTQDYGWVAFECSIDRNQSYIYDSDRSYWQDLYDYDCCARIKGFVSTQEGSIVPESISIQEAGAENKIQLSYGDEKHLKVKFTPSISTVRELTWESSNPEIASISENGMVTTCGVGETTITATTSNGKTAEVIIYVPAPQIAAPTSTYTNLYGYDDIKFSWAKAVGATGYYVYYKRSSWNSWYYLCNTTGTYAKKANLTDGALYYFKVYPYVNINGKRYISTRYKTGSGLYTLKTVSRPAVKKKSRYYINIRWGNIAGESGYQIARSKYKSKKFSVVRTCSSSYKSANIKTPRYRTYYYKIRAYKVVNGTRIYAPWSSVRAYRLR